MSLHNPLDVIIVGGGPVGMFLAIELRRLGRDVTVIERLAEPSRQIKAGSIGPQSARTLADRGLADKINQVDLAALMGKPAVQRADTARSAGPPVGHFGGLWLLRGDPGQTTPPIIAAQHDVETMLNAEAVAYGVTVLRRHELESFTDDGDRVHARITGPGGALELTADFLVGCDGGRSTVRKRAGFAFTGTDGTITGRQAVVDIVEPVPLEKGWHRTEHGMIVFGPGPRRVLTVEFDGPPDDRDSPVNREEIEDSLRRVSGTNVEVAALRTGTRWTDTARLADTYRRGRIFLAGDAAHVHPPFGGQGLSLGLQDAATLGWKLVAHFDGDATDDLLDSYTAERRPAAETALDNCRAQVAIMRPDPQTTALRNLFAELMEFDDANALVSRRMAGESRVPHNA